MDILCGLTTPTQYPSSEGFRRLWKAYSEPLLAVLALVSKKSEKRWLFQKSANLWQFDTKNPAFVLSAWR